jgi:hypothetical protein
VLLDEDRAAGLIAVMGALSWFEEESAAHAAIPDADS